MGEGEGHRWRGYASPNGKYPKSCSSRVSNSKLGSLVIAHNKCIGPIQSVLEYNKSSCLKSIEHISEDYFPKHRKNYN